MGKKKKRGSGQQTTPPLIGTVISPVGPERAVTSQSLGLLRRAAQTQSQEPLRLWAVQTLAEDPTPRFPAKPVPQYSLSPSRTQRYLPSPSRTQEYLPSLSRTLGYLPSPSRTQEYLPSPSRTQGQGRIQVERTLGVGIGSFRFEYSKKWAPRSLEITLPSGARLKVEGFTNNEIGQLLRLLKAES